MKGTDGIVRVVGGAIVDSLVRPERLLVARRTAPPHFAGLWEFPGGKVEPGETPTSALLRELREELGVEVRLGAEIVPPGPEGWPLNAEAVMRVWFAEILEGSPEALEDHDELRWVPLASHVDDQLMGLPWIPADFPIVKAVRVQAFP